VAIQFNPLIFSGLDLTGGGAAGAAEWREPVANEAALPLVGNSNGEARVTLDTDKIYVWDATSSRWVDTGITAAAFGNSPNANGQTIGTDDSTANIRRRTITLQPADATNPGGISTTTQSIAGAKTFLDQVKIDEASNQLVLGTTNTTTITAPNPAANRTITLPDAGGDSSVVLTEGNQTLNGTKTFSSTVITNSGIDVAATAGTDTLTIGGTNADVINVGRSGATVNVIGTTFNQQVTNVNVEDKNITVNSGGPAGSGATSGIDVEEGGSITGYVEVSGDRNSWVLKAPNTAGGATITPGASGITINQSSHDPVTLTTLGASPNASGATLSTQQLTLQPADGTNPGLITAGTQTLGGDKTFTGTISASNLSGTNTGDVTLTAVGSSPNANAASLSGQQLTIQPADGTNPGVLTAGTQTIGGAKTFSSNVTATVNYTPADSSDWLSPTPTTVAGGLDALADKIVQYDEVTKEPTGFPNTTDSSTSFDDLSRTFTIQPVGVSFDFYVKGKKFTKTTAQNVTISTTAGNHYIYFDSTGTLSETTALSSTLFSDNALVSVIYWNSDTNTRTYFAEERHGLVMDGATHTYLHTVFGARYLSGLALQNFSVNGTGDLATDAQFTSDSGTLRDEDLLITLAAETQIAILYRQGQLWRKKTADAFPIIYSGTAGYTGANGRLPYNQFTGGSWQLTQVSNNKFVLVHFFGTNDKETPVVGIQGIAEYNDVTAARVAANSEITSLSGLPFAEFVAIGSVVFETANGYANVPKARVRSVNGGDYVDFRGTQLYTPAGVATTHSLLSGLANDDHTQYLLADGSRSVSGDLTIANQHSLKLSEAIANGLNTVALKAPAAITSDFALTLPSALPASSDLALVSNTSGDISYLYVLPASQEDIKRTSFTALDNQAVAASVTGLSFSNAVTRGFEAQITIVRGSTYAEYSLKGIQKGASWEMSQEYVGDAAGVSFTISNSGQIEYTTTSTGNNAALLFRAQTV